MNGAYFPLPLDIVFCAENEIATKLESLTLDSAEIKYDRDNCIKNRLN